MGAALNTWLCLRGKSEHILSYGDKKVTKHGNYMDVDAPKLLSLTMLKGTNNGLQDPHSILLSESLVKALFGSADPLNRLLKIDNKLAVKVTGVYEDIPYNAKFSGLTFIAPWDLYTTSENWITRDRDEGRWGR